mmetsp:Transcript_125241/g.227150  ORF Transcript_125241/g.227150 Transcript_125241/m.227150 type:complete len:1118 (-) Transcript_125241:103-3456(-)
MSCADLDQFVALLGTLLSSDNAARNAAEKTLKDAQRSNPNEVILSIAKCLDSSSFPNEVLRTQAATLLRRMVVPVGSSDEAPWLRASQEVQSQVKQILFRALETENVRGVQKMLVAVVSAVADVAKSSASWPELMPNTFALAKSTSPVHQEISLRLLAELLGTGYAPSVLACSGDLSTLIQSGLVSPALQSHTVHLVCEMVGVLEAPQQKSLQGVLPAVEEAVKSLARSDPAAFEEVVQDLIAVATDNSAFFKPRLGQWMQIMLELTGQQSQLSASQRALAFEWASTAVESKPKQALKAIPNLAQTTLEAAFAFLAQVKDDEGWVDIDEEEEEDDDDVDDTPLHKIGEAKVDFFVEKFGFSHTKATLMTLIGNYGGSPSWEGRFAAATAIRAAVEYVEEDQAALDAMAKFLIGLVQDPHMRVRYAALHAIGQMCHDQPADFHERWHAELVPQLLVAGGDAVDRVASMAISSLETVVGDLGEASLETHASQVLEMLVTKMSSCRHAGVLGSSLELMGALAAGLEGNFDSYYDKLMPMLLAFIGGPGAQSSSSSGKLRGKVFECISLLGFAVGKEHFAPAFQQTMSAMMASPLEADDVQKEYIRETIVRMCEIMGSDFAPFLPALLPNICASIVPEAAVTTGETRGEQAGEISIETDKGMVSVKTGQIEEMAGAVKILSVFVKETGVKFFEYIKPTTEVLARVLRHSGDEAACLTSDLRDAVYPCWAELVQVAVNAIPSQGDPAKVLVTELVQVFVDKVGADLASAEDPGDIAPMADGIACVVRNAGEGALQPDQVKLICGMCMAEIEKSFQREKAGASASQALTGAKARDDDEEDSGDEAGDEEDEAQCRIGLVAIIGACIRANREVFMSHVWPTVLPSIQQWLQPPVNEGCILGLHMAVDLCDHLKEAAVPVWPVFMEAVLNAVVAQVEQQRNAGAYAVNLAAEVPAFGPQYAARAYVALGSSLQKFKAKKNDEDAQRAQDNAAAALVTLCLRHPDQCPDLDACWKLALGKLPCKVDLKEGRRTHRKLFEEASKPGGGNLSSMARVVVILGYLADVYNQSEHCDDALRADIARSFAGLPEATLSQIVAQLTNKQQKAVERIVRDGTGTLMTFSSLDL